MLWIAYFIVLVLVLTFAIASVKGAPWVPMKQADVKRIIALAGIKPGETFYDLGSGDGRLLIAAAQAGALARGFEISLLPYLVSIVRTTLSPYRASIRIRFRDFWSAHLGNGDIVFFFLTPWIYERLEEKFRRELRPGARIMAYVWPLKDRVAIQSDRKAPFPDVHLYKS